MSFDHIVSSYDADLKKLKDDITAMGKLVVKQLSHALMCVKEPSEAEAKLVISQDPKIDAFEREIDGFAVKILALRRPVAGDLRSVISALKISSDLERIADYAANMAKRSMKLDQNLGAQYLEHLSYMVEKTQSMIEDVLGAYVNNDVDIAMDVWHRDSEIDDIYGELLQSLITHMSDNKSAINDGTQILFIAKNIERVGDHVTNISEMIHYQVHGTSFVGPER